MDAKNVLQCLTRIRQLEGEKQLEEAKINKVLSQMKDKNCDVHYTGNCAQLVCDYVSSLNKRDAIREELLYQSCIFDVPHVLETPSQR